MANILFGTNPDLVARPSGTQANATALRAGINSAATVASTGDAFILPPAATGLPVILVNNGASTAQVFGQPTNPFTGVGDVITAGGSSTPAPTATGVSQAATTVSIYFVFKPGNWKQVTVAT